MGAGHRPPGRNNICGGDTSRSRGRLASTRLYFGAHFPLDALGGAALEIAVGATVHLVMDRITHHH